MKLRITAWAAAAVAIFCLTVPAMADEVSDPGQSGPRRHRADQARSNAEERWKSLDPDNDGKISRSEWQRNEQGFDQMDIDKDGFLTKEELRSAAREFHARHRRGLPEMDADADGNISRSEWKGKEEVFSRLDSNNDGLLSRDELRGARKRHGMRSHRPTSDDKTL